MAPTEAAAPGSPTTVATEFAASWNPFVKSKTSANTMTPMMAISNPSMDSLCSEVVKLHRRPPPTAHTGLKPLLRRAMVLTPPAGHDRPASSGRR